MPELVTLHTGDSDPHGLRKQYFALRSRTFSAMTEDDYLYPNGPDEYDLNASTKYYFLVEDGKVVTGARMIFHAKGSDTKLSFETRHKHLLDARTKLFPHLDYNQLRYAEYSGLVVDADFRKKGYGQYVHDAILQDYNDAGIDADVLVFTSADTSHHLMDKPWPERLKYVEGPQFKDLQYNIKSYIVSSNPDFPLTPPGKSNYLQ